MSRTPGRPLMVPSQDFATGARWVTLGILGLAAWLGLPGTGPRAGGALDAPPPLGASVAALDSAGWELLHIRAAEAPVSAVVSGEPAPVVVEPPRRLRAGRTSALRIHALDSVRTTLWHPDGTEDTVYLAPGETGAFVLRPFTPGWRSWRLTAQRAGSETLTPSRGGGEILTAEWGTRIHPPAPVRVLAVSGPPGPEARAVLRSLEEAGEEVTSWAHLGRGVWMGLDGTALPRDAEVYAAYDVVLLFPGIAVPAEAAEAMVRAVEEMGLGLLLAATTGNADALRGVIAELTGGGSWQDEVTVPATSLQWRLPPEMVPLPTISLETRVLVGGEAPSYDLPPMALGARGRGRVGALALPDTWTWRMRAGALDGHRSFWRETVTWLSDGFHGEPLLEILVDQARSGDRVLVRRVDTPSESEQGGPTALLLHTPAGTQTLETAAEPGAGFGRSALGTFVPETTGAYTITADPTDEPADEAPANPASAAHFQVRAAGAGALDPEGRLARLALSSPGGTVTVDSALAAGTVATRPATPWLTYLFVLVALLLAAEWIHRRLGARP